MRPAAPRERSWLPMAVAAAIVLAVLAGVVLIYEHGRRAPVVTPATGPLDAYAANLPISQLAMSEAANLAGGKSTYLDGKIANNGTKTVTGINVQVLFRDPAHEVAWNITQPLMLIRTRDPYIYRCGARGGGAAEAGRHAGFPADFR